MLFYKIWIKPDFKAKTSIRFTQSKKSPNILSLHCCDLVSLAGEGDWGLGGLGVILHNCQTGALH